VSAEFYLFLYIGLIVSGVLLSVFISQFPHLTSEKHYKERNFSTSRYVFLLLFPAISIGIMTYLAGGEVLIVFAVSCMVGWFLEWLVGFCYHMVVGEKLWIYKRLHINEYTSRLSIPLWGLAGVLLWLLAQVFD
jgi:hypothetical protein